MGVVVWQTSSNKYVFQTVLQNPKLSKKNRHKNRNVWFLRSYFLVSEKFYLVNPICLQRNTYSCYTSRPRNFGVWYMQRWNILFGLSWRSCGLVYYRKVGLNWWRGLKIYVLTYFQVTQKKNTFFGERPPQLKHQTFATMNLLRTLLNVIKEHLCICW